jgi:hypothetical protein
LRLTLARTQNATEPAPEPNDLSGKQERNYPNHVETEPDRTDLTFNP